MLKKDGLLTLTDEEIKVIASETEGGNVQSNYGTFWIGVMSVLLAMQATPGLI